MTTNTMNRQERAIADKLNRLDNINTYWDDVRSFTTKSMSTETEENSVEVTAEQKFNEMLALKWKQCDLLNEMYAKHYDVDRPNEYYAALEKLTEINKQLSELETKAYEEMKQTNTAEETATVERNLESENQIDLKSDEEMHETFNAVRGKISKVGNIEQKNAVYKIPWGVYRAYSAAEIINVILANTNEILKINSNKSGNSLKAVSALIESAQSMTTSTAMKLITDYMKKAGAAAKQIAQVEIAIQYIGNPEFRGKLNNFVFTETYSPQISDSTANDSEASAQWKIRPPPIFLFEIHAKGQAEPPALESKKSEVCK